MLLTKIIDFTVSRCLLTIYRMQSGKVYGWPSFSSFTW